MDALSRLSLSGENVLLQAPMFDGLIFDGHAMRATSLAHRRAARHELILAEEVGFEPTDGFPHRWFSRPVP